MYPCHQKKRIISVAFVISHSFVYMNTLLAPIYKPYTYIILKAEK